MELEEVLDRKVALETQIRDFVSQAFGDFTKETSLYPNSIEIDLADVTNIGSIRKESMIIGCKVKVEI